MDKVLITGAGGMLGRYVADQFTDNEIYTLGLKEDSGFICDLTKSSPDFNGKTFNTIIHCAGTENDALAMELNYEGTRRLVKGLGENIPENFVYVSSHRVYSRDAGENIDEDTNTWATDESGKSKSLAENFLIDWAQKHDVTITIIRPATMFGNGVSGEMLQLFNDAISGKYIHIRDNDARTSIVTALDVAIAIKKLYDKGGIYNATDGKNPRLIDLVEAMTANAGAKKRMTHLPIAWAEWIWRLGRWIPSIERNLSPFVVEKRMKTLTLDGSRLAQKIDMEFHDTIRVIERTDNSYPYTQ